MTNTKKSISKLLAIVIAFAMLTGLAVPAFAADTNEDESIQEESIRLAGKDRYETAIEVSKAMYPQGSDKSNLVITSGTNTADALAAGPLAIELEAPILLVGANDDAVDEEVKRLGVENIFIVGGENSVGKEYESKYAGASVKRLAGDDRYATSVKVGEYLAEEFDYNNAVIANGTNTVDALASSAFAVENDAVILLSPAQDLNESVATYIQSDKVEKVYIVGGVNSISDNVESLLGNKFAGRIDGPDRYQTAIELGQKVYENPESVVMVSGDNDKLVDALAAAPYAYKNNMPIILTGLNQISAETAEYLGQDSISDFVVIGGENTVSPEAVDEIAKAIGLDSQTDEAEKDEESPGQGDDVNNGEENTEADEESPGQGDDVDSGEENPETDQENKVEDDFANSVGEALEKVEFLKDIGSYDYDSEKRTIEVTISNGNQLVNDISGTRAMLALGELIQSSGAKSVELFGNDVPLEGTDKVDLAKLRQHIIEETVKQLNDRKESEEGESLSTNDLKIGDLKEFTFKIPIKLENGEDTVEDTYWVKFN